PTFPTTADVQPSRVRADAVLSAQPPPCRETVSTNARDPVAGSSSNGHAITSATRIPRQTTSGVTPDPAPGSAARGDRPRLRTSVLKPARRRRRPPGRAQRPAPPPRRGRAGPRTGRPAPARRPPRRTGALLRGGAERARARS